MEDTQKELTKRIASECKARDVSVTKDLVAFLLSLYELNPAYRVKEESDVESTARLTGAVTERLCDQSRPSLTTLKSQLYFAKHYHERDETVKRHRLRLHQKTGPLIAEIYETSKLESGKDTEKLYQRILVAITLLSGLGSPTVPTILREVSVALQSVFQASELSRYVTLPKREKEEQLMELMCIVAGIRLFNRDCQRGGEEIDDLPSILQEALTKTRNSILELLEPLMSKVYTFTAAVENAIAARASTTAAAAKNDTAGCDSTGAASTEENVEWAIEMLAASRQQEIHIRKLLSDMEHSENAVKSLTERLRARLFKLHDTVRYRTAIPTAQVYPQFIDLADIWMGLQDEVIILSSVNSFLWQLQSLSNKIVNVYDRTRLDDIIGDAEVLTDAERLERSMGNLITECGECLIYYPNVTKHFEKINLEFLGFCAWTVIAGKGTLIPGNPNNGVAKWRGKYYAFESPEAAIKFGEDPDRYVYEALDFIRNRPEYVHLFQLHEEIQAMRSQEELTDEGLQLKVRRNQKVQTDVHILPPYVDKDYTSSVWELKRRALRLASISRCVTRSTQTLKSHGRYGIYVQTTSPRDKEVQTRKDNYTNTKSLKTFIFGLRGRRDDNQHIVSFLEDESERMKFK